MEAEDLLIQIEVFEERKLEDEEEMMFYTGAEGVDIADHKDVFLAIFNKVSFFGFEAVCSEPAMERNTSVLMCRVMVKSP